MLVVVVDARSEAPNAEESVIAATAPRGVELLEFCDPDIAEGWTAQALGRDLG